MMIGIFIGDGILAGALETRQLTLTRQIQLGYRSKFSIYTFAKYVIPKLDQLVTSTKLNV
jgi:hypothetical protein